MSDEMRDDGHLPATKADLSAFATKAEMNAGFRAVADRLDGNGAGIRAVTGRLDGHDANLRRLNISFARLEGDMTEVKVKVAVIAEEFAWVKSFLERMNGNIEAALRKTDLQGSMLMDHEGRLKKLESRPS